MKKTKKQARLILSRSRLVELCRLLLFISRAFAVRLRYSYILRRLRKRAKNERVRVLFLVHNPSKWKAQSLYREMNKSDRFAPLMAVDFHLEEIGKFHSAEEKISSDIAFYQALGNRCVRVYDTEKNEPVDLSMFKPDIVFFQEPWLMHRIHGLLHVSQFALCCYIPYSVDAIMDANDGKGIVDDIHFMRHFHQLMFLNITWSDSHAKYSMRKRHPWEMAGKFIGLGHTALDPYTFCDYVDASAYVIYAPHFSIEHGDAKALLKLATFKENGAKLLAYAQKHPEYNWLFKPHPVMRRRFIETGYMTAEEVDRYFDEWRRIGTVCLDGDYPKLFNSSRALITDSGSFLMEYAATGRPIIRPVPENLNVFPCPAAKKVIDSLYETHGVEELMSTIKMILEDGRDPKREERVTAAREAGLIGSHAAENILHYFEDLIRVK